jgi:hypothetical protein
MAITRTQIAKQLLAQGGRIGYAIGGREAGYEGPTGSTGSTGDKGQDNRDRYMGTMGKTRPGRNPMAQFGGDKPPPAYDDFEETSKRNFNFMRQARKKANPLGFLTEIPGFTGGLFRSLTPNPFGFTTTAPQNVTGGEGDGPVPYWAQLGYSSEAEYLAAQALGTTEQESEEPFEMSRRFRAEGGIMNTDVVGGEMDFESARQMYSLGKLVKKVTRSVKKIAKSDLGKAALIGAAAFGIPGTSLGGIFGRASFMVPAGGAPGMFGFGGIGNALAAGKAKFLTKAPIDRLAFNAARTAGEKAGGLGIGSAILGASALAGALTPEQEEEAQLISDNTGFSIEEARNSILARARDDYKMDFRARGFRAEGGPAEGEEPVAKKTMPLLDMDGQEMDLRAEGGFVPIGRMEKADDVPARLSKNEFVFTADAVRNAGEGDVDKGAEVMYNMMKNLESGGDVSEESQGLDGARDMFKTSQRLEEVL